MLLNALERTFAKKMTYGGMQVEERIARIGSGDPGSHLGIPKQSYIDKSSIKKIISLHVHEI
jgi:hypothetical protein